MHHKKRKSCSCECICLNSGNHLGDLFTRYCSLSSLSAHRGHLVDARTGSFGNGNLASHRG